MQPDAALIAGIAAYRRHPSSRTLRDPAPIWTDGEVRLLDYAPGCPGRPILFVPSLVNRGYVLDLAEGHSLLRHLAAAGQRPLLLDWGWPGVRERDFTLTDYVAGTLERAVIAVGQPLTLAGYCMGGLLAMAAAQRRPDLVKALVLLATPWDFWNGAPAAPAALAALPLLPLLPGATGTVPVDVLQTAFAMVDPGAVGRKFRRFGASDQTGAAARLFVAIEDWVNDGVPLAVPVARECLAGWYGANTPARGEWRIAGAAIMPEVLDLPCLLAAPSNDRIVPRTSALPLARRLRRAALIEPAGGHVGMIAGERAEAALWRPMLDWLARL